MAINLDLVIESEDGSVDMKAGLVSMQGVSDTVRCISESILTEKVPERQTAKSMVRTSLKKSFKGSYGHIFTLDVHDIELQKKLNKIGQSPFVELLSYFISESLYRESNQLSLKAQKVLDQLGENVEKVVQQLRVSSLENVHEISTKFNHDIKIRYRKNRNEQTIIANFDRNSAEVLEAKPSNEKIDLKAVITRLNIHTGNGRLQVEGQYETVAFGFIGEYREVRMNIKKILSENLDYNNGLDSDKWKYLEMNVTSIKMKDGKVVKYIVKGIV
jgi:hypothetical protein